MKLGTSLKRDLPRADPANTRFFSKPPRMTRWHFDLPAYVADRVRRAGVTAVELLGRCTYEEEENFFSYRRTTHRQGAGLRPRLVGHHACGLTPTGGTRLSTSATVVPFTPPCPLAKTHRFHVKPAGVLNEAAGRQQQSSAGGGHRSVPAHSVHQGAGAAVRRYGGVCRNRRERAG